MIRPVDIQEKEFTKAVRGYKEEEVNEFLDEITVDMERLLEELRQTKEENSRLVEELERHRSSEGTVLETLEAAKSLMADISASAEKRADILLKNAELDAQLMQKEAKDMADKISEESEAMKSRFINFRNQYKQLLESELQRFESLSGEMLPELGVDDFDDLPAAGAADRPQPQMGTYNYEGGSGGAGAKKTVRIKY
ncbi:MAG TPA: DivIVA domain-containing protein [Candidatus Copromorpha excrementigallinarum]|uniref:DivIVA domain-containing protein n=1 Tax=Candidatus Allocopromorpha excrementigallinarum TaxID=2840742 RepID=A0A9D1L5J1_9FIRM|nr:DivIVA domain-containing protein [Candidatus Copromorpha excrementigallinarum]